MVTAMAETISFREVKLEGGWLMVKPEREDLGKAMSIVRNHKDRLYDLEVKEHKKKRSLDANAYAWVMISKLAEKLNIPKTDIYRSAIKEIGGNSDVVCIQDKAVDSLCDGWQRNGIGWLTERFPSKLDGCTNVTLYYGSSTYDTAQMSRLINIIVEECRQLGIETKSKEEVESLLKAWG